MIALVVLSTVCGCMLIGMMSIMVSQKAADQSAVAIMNLNCQNVSDHMDGNLRSAEQAVEMMSVYAMDQLLSYDRIAGNEHYRRQYTEGIADVFSDVAGMVPGVFSYYVRYDPGFAKKENGFLYSRRNMDEKFEKREFNDLSDDAGAHSSDAQSYYMPIEAGKAVWLNPYYSENLDLYMISYIKPMYKETKLIGIVGVDVDFSSMMKTVADMTTLKTGYAALTSETGEVYYHPILPSGSNIGDFMTLKNNDLKDVLKEKESGDILLSYSFRGVTKKMAFSTLRNGMKLWLTANASEINETQDVLIRNIIAIVLTTTLIFAGISLFLSRQALQPLQELTEAAKEIEAGNFDAPLPPVRSKDEIGVLTDAFNHTIQVLRQHMSFVSSLAYKDALTGVKNRAAYEEMIRDLEKNHVQEYGIVVFDLNNLKLVNDEFGHECGDAILQTASRRICNVFKHSPVFRLGGDEFAVILRGVDYENRDALMKKFEEVESSENAGLTPNWRKTWVAYGYAVFENEVDHSAADVFNRADSRMYVQKEVFKKTFDPKTITA